MGTENDSSRGGVPRFRGMSQTSSDQMRIDALEEELRQLNPNSPVIVNVNNGSNTNQSRTLFTDTSTRADDNPQLDAITTGGAAQVDFTQSWIGHKKRRTGEPVLPKVPQRSLNLRWPTD